jgi:hypothetical protein
METEEIVTNSSTGGKKGQKLARYDLIPADPLKQIAEHFGKGVKKYTQYGECTCSVVAENLSMPAANAAIITKNRSDSETLSLPSDSARIVANGLRSTESEKENKQKLTNSQRSSCDTNEDGSTASVPMNMTPSLRSPAIFAESQKNLDMSTITMRQATSEGPSVMDATLASGLLKNGASIGCGEHLPGCMALKIVQAGDRNWELGTNWSLNFAALQRHAWQWWNGEDLDEETQSNHLAAVAWHALVLLEFSDTHPELDDRPGRKSS